VSYLFVLRSYPDIDHMLPLAWKLAAGGEEVHAIVSPGYDPEPDHRLRFARRSPTFHLHEIAPARSSRGGLGGLLARARALARSTLPYALLFMLRKRVRLVAVEWGYGLPEGYDRLGSPAGVVAVLRSLAGSLKRIGHPSQIRANFVVAARLLGRATVCLPHGLSIKLDAVSTNSDLGRTIDWRDRNRFSAYVMNTDHHRRWFLEHAQGDPRVVETWGSLRWSPEWFELNRRIAPELRWPVERDGAVKVVFMLPKWRNRVHPERAIALIKRLQSLDAVSLAIKGHPRPTQGSADPLRSDPDVDWSRIHDMSAADSVSLIRAADAVIDVGSSIGIETVMQRKVLINPTYVHELTTLFDDIPGSCVVANDADEVEAALMACAEGRPPLASDGAHAELMRRAVYGSRPEPFDVLDHYTTRVRGLAGAGAND
jgi:hypothetical protein